MNIKPLDVKIDWKADKLSDFDLSECTYLEVRHHSCKSFDFSNLPDAPNLKKLEIVFSNSKNLIGLDKYPYLESIDLYYLRNLMSLDGIEKMSSRIEYFSIQSARKLTNIDSIVKLKNLKGLGFINIGDINDLDFLYDMYEIESLAFGDTKILSGDLTPIVNHFNIKLAGFQNKRHYSHTNNEIDFLLLKKEISHKVTENKFK